MRAAAVSAGRGLGRARRAVRWPFADLRRILVLAWMVGLGVVGSAGLAAADTGLIPGPDLAGGSAQTVFERAPTFGYGLPVFVPPTMSWPTQAMWAGINFLAWLVEMLCAILVRGALVLMQWMLDLTLYRDSASEIDTATQGLAADVFWPLIGCTVASAGFTLYALSRSEGRGSILGELVKVAVLTVLAITLATAPSRVVAPLDDARTAASNAIMTGYSRDHLTAGGAVAGFPPVPVSGPNAASRSLADSMWSTFVLTPWCYSAFGGEDLCRQWGQDVITKSPRWKDTATRIMVADIANGMQQGSTPDVCAQTFADACDTVRGVTLDRLGAALVGALIALPVAVLLLLLTGFGLVALVAVLLLALMAPVFVLGWMIPGLPRQIGLRWFQALTGSMIQSALIVALLGAIMVLGGILQSLIPHYGFWVVGVLNLAVVVTALKARAMFDGLIGMTTPGSSLASSYVAMKTLGMLGRHVKGVGRAAGRVAGAVGKGAVAGTVGGAKLAAAGIGRVDPALSAVGNYGARQAAGLRSFFSVPATRPSTGGIAPPYRRVPVTPSALPAGATATPYRDGSHTSGQGPRSLPGPQVVDALPSTPQRTAIGSAGSSTATQTGGPTHQGAPPAPKGRRQQHLPQSPARTFAAGTGQAGVAPSATRRIAVPMRRDIHTPPLPSRARSAETLHWGSGNPLHITRRPAPELPPAPRRRDREEST